MQGLKTGAPAPPEGSFTAEGAMINETPTVNAATSVKGSEGIDILKGDLRVNMLVKDPYTGELIRLDNVLVKRTPGTIITGLEDGQRFRVKILDYNDLRQRKTINMEAEPTGSDPVLQNRALPTPVKYKNNFDAIATKPTTMCRKFKQEEEEFKKKMGILIDRNDVSILQGKANGRSPGVLVHQEDGKVYMFDNTGKQYIAIDGQKVKINAIEVDTGQAKKGCQVAGFPVDMEENPMLNYTPQGTILTPNPKVIPAVTKMMNTINTITDLIDLVKTCGDAIKKIRQEPAPIVRAQAQQQASESSFMKAIYGQDTKTTEVNTGRFDKYKRNK